MRRLVSIPDLCVKCMIIVIDIFAASYICEYIVLANIAKIKRRQILDIIVMGTVTGAPLLPYCVLVTEALNEGQGPKLPRGISRSCQDEQLV